MWLLYSCILTSFHVYNSCTFFCKILVNCHAYNESECVMPSWHNWQKTTSPNQQNQPYWSIPDSFTVSRQQPELNYCELVVLLSHRHLHCVFIITHLCHQSGYIPRLTSDPCLCNNNDLSCNWTCNCAKPQSYCMWTTVCFDLQIQPCFLFERCF